MNWGELEYTNDDERITIGMASIPGRMLGMQATIEALLPQCDQFDVYLNNYPGGFHVPVFDDAKVNVFHGTTDIGARGKLYMAHRTPGYFLTVDDDLIYPSNYVMTAIAGIEKYKRQAVCGFHGVHFGRDPDPMQPNPRILYSHAGNVPADMIVHMLGTGLLAYHSDTIKIDWRKFEPGKIDEQTAILCQEQRIPMICLAHPEDFVVEDADLMYVDALRRNKPASQKAIERQQREWHFYIPQCWKDHQRFP